MRIVTTTKATAGSFRQAQDRLFDSGFAVDQDDNFLRGVKEKTTAKTKATHLHDETVKRWATR
jgi:hypothetical protein